MVITIAKAYKRGGNVACVTDADMFLTEVSSIIIHRSEELMLPYVDGSGSEHYTKSARFPAKNPRTALPPAR